MFTFTVSVPINDGAKPELTPQQVWQGLLIRGRNGDDRFVPPNHRFTVLEDNGDWLIRRVELSNGVEELQRVTFHGENLKVYQFIEGPQLGMMLTTIETDERGEYCLKMTFIVKVEGIEHGSDEEEELANRRRPMMAKQPALVLEVVRELVNEGVL